MLGTWKEHDGETWKKTLQFWPLNADSWWLIMVNSGHDGLEWDDDHWWWYTLRQIGDDHGWLQLIITGDSLDFF